NIFQKEEITRPGITKNDFFIKAIKMLFEIRIKRKLAFEFFFPEFHPVADLLHPEIKHTTTLPKNPAGFFIFRNGIHHRAGVFYKKLFPEGRFLPAGALFLKSHPDYFKLIPWFHGPE